MGDVRNSTKLHIIKTITICIVTLLLFGGVYYVTITARHIVKKIAIHKNQLSVVLQGKFAIKIFPGTLTMQAKSLLAGFSLQEVRLSDGTEQITLLAKKQDFTSQVLIVKPGDSVYFIDQQKNDDKKDTGDDLSLHDDKAIVVDKNGHQVSQ